MSNENVINDCIKRPSHYCDGRKYEPKDVIRDWNLNFNLGNVIKYIARHGKKAGESDLKDLEKAATYLGFEIDYLKQHDDTIQSYEEETHVNRIR